MISSKNKDYILSLAAFSPIPILMLQVIILTLHILPHEKSRVIAIFISALLMVPSMFIVLRRRKWLFIFACLTIILLILYTLIFFPVNTQCIKSGSFYILLVNLPTFLCIASIKNIAYLNQIILIISRLVFFGGLIVVSLILLGLIQFSTYNMPFSYYLLMPALIFLNQKKTIYYVGFVIICIIMLFFGSRGPLFASIVYLFISNKFFITSKLYIKLLIFLIAIILLLANFNSILFYLEDSFNISSRTLSLLLSGHLTSDSGRMTIYSKVWESIIDKPFWGYGLFSDRVLLGNINTEVYAHNLFLEVFHNFGILAGGLIIVIITMLSIKIYFNLTKTHKTFFITVAIYSLLPLMFSGSYLTSNLFALYLGMISLFSQKEQKEVDIT